MPREHLFYPYSPNIPVYFLEQIYVRTRTFIDTVPFTRGGQLSALEHFFIRPVLYFKITSYNFKIYRL
jgi:hypothetical protein